MYYKRPQRKRIYNYLMPFLIIVFIFAAIIFGWSSLNNIFIDQNRNTSSEKVFLNIESGSAKNMTVGKSEWQNAPDKIYLYRGEKFKTGTDGRATFTFFDQSIMRLNTNTEVSFTSLKKKNDTHEIEIELVKGDAWAKVERITNPSSSFGITTDLITIDTRGGAFAISGPGTVYMMEGTAQIGIKYDDDVIKTYNLGVGQQFLADAEKAQAIEKGDDVEVIFALSDQFKRTNWYRWNIKKDGAVNAFEESDLDETDDEAVGTQDPASQDEEEDDTEEDLANVGRVVYVTDPSKNFETNKSTITIKGNFDADKINAVYVDGAKATVTGAGKWSVASVKLGFEGENEITIEAEELDGAKTTLDPLVVVYDKTAPDMPVFIDPGANDETVEIEDIEQIIEGTASKDTAALIVNDYRLTKYVPGSKEFTYFAKTVYGNLEVGDNEYKAIAEDKAGNQSEPAIITLTLTQEVADNADEESVGTQDPASDTDEEEELPQASSSGGVEITDPNNGESFTTSETEFEIIGTVPESTAKVEVNNYPLSLFKLGDTTFKYRAYVSIGNLKIGEKNTYTVKAYDEDDKLLGEASITIDIESGSSAAPIVTIPVSSGTYSTTLDTIVVGGTVGKWVTRMYVNDKELTEYIPGSEQWRTSINLNSGKNTLVVSAEKAGEPVGKATIEITYTP